jgi:hypothetical protein
MRQDSLLNESALAKLAAGGVIAIALYLGVRRRGNNPYVMPGIPLAGMSRRILSLPSPERVSPRRKRQAGCSRRLRQSG